MSTSLGDRSEANDGAERFSLARRDHLAIFLGLLLKQGAICPHCAYGTRVTSKRWARCKKCNARVPRGAGTDSAVLSTVMPEVP